MVFLFLFKEKIYDYIFFYNNFFQSKYSGL